MTHPATAIHGWFAAKAPARHARAAQDGWRCICCEDAAPWPLLTCGRFACEARPKVWVIKAAAAVRRALKHAAKAR